MPRLSSADVDEAVHMLREYKRVSCIAEHLGVTPKTVYAVAKKNGLCTRGQVRKLSEAGKFAVMEYIQQGKSDTEIASLMNISHAGIRKHTIRLRRALDKARHEMEIA